jgi:hypothetical protein
MEDNDYMSEGSLRVVLVITAGIVLLLLVGIIFQN